MLYIITFYTADPAEGETTVIVHEVTRAQIDAYTAAPDTTLAAIRIAEPKLRIDGFRVVDENGKLVMDHFEDDDRS